MTETTIPENYYSLQHFITDSPWDSFELINAVSQQINDCLPKRKLTGLHIDESGVRKKGKKSVGVGRQYCGNLGKVDNCQVAVYASLNNGDFAALVDARLYLPEDWTKNQKRCEEAGIPLECQQFKTKPEIALELIQHQVDKGIRFDYVGVDALYGADQKCTDKMDQKGWNFIGDIRSNQQIYLEQPRIEIPERKGKAGRKPTKLKADIKPIAVEEYIKTLKKKDWTELKVRNTAKGTLKGKYHFCTVYIWDGESHQASKRLLIIRKTGKKKVEIKYSLSNVNLVQYDLKAVAYMQAQRFFIEHTFKEAKSVLGIHQFQTRKWLSWYHQIALNLLLLSFILKEKLLNFLEIPLLSAWDIQDVLVIMLFVFIRPEGMIACIRRRHKYRQSDINRYYSMC